MASYQWRREEISDALDRIANGWYTSEHGIQEDKHRVLQQFDDAYDMLQTYSATIDRLLFPKPGKTVPSVVASLKIRPKAGSYRHKIMGYICREPGVSCEQIETVLNMKHQTVSARLCELKKAGWVDTEILDDLSRYSLTDEGKRVLKGIG